MKVTSSSTGTRRFWMRGSQATADQPACSATVPGQQGLGLPSRISVLGLCDLQMTTASMVVREGDSTIFLATYISGPAVDWRAGVRLRGSA